MNGLRAVFLAAAFCAVATPGFARSKPVESRWDPIRKVFGQEGELEDGYLRIDFPRSDLRIRIGNDELSPRFEFTGYVGFVPLGKAQVLAVGEVVLSDEELSYVLWEAHAQDVTVSAVHNHLVGETPRIVYVHILAKGEPGPLAERLRRVFAKSGVPLEPAKAEPSTADWSAVDAVLGPHAEAEGAIAEYVFPRREAMSVHGIAVKSTGALETASEVVFQRLPDGRVANTGELLLLPGEVDPVVRALDRHGLHVTAVHNHMTDEKPVTYWVHWYATGDGAEVARKVAAVLAMTNSRQRSEAE